jgi:hypothetical protein
VAAGGGMEWRSGKPQAASRAAVEKMGIRDRAEKTEARPRDGAPGLLYGLARRWMDGQDEKGRADGRTG